MQVLSRTIQSCRQKQSGFPANPVARHGFEIPDEYGKLDNGEQFLRYDSGIDDHQRILIFASERALEDIASYCHWACDGTFKIVPEQWYQLMCIHVQVNGSTFPRVFALLPNKTRQTYESVFEQLKILQPNVNPIDLMADFEVAIHKSFNSALAFLPTEDVEEAYEELIDDEIPSELTAYFDVTYMGVVRGRGAR